MLSNRRLNELQNMKRKAKKKRIDELWESTDLDHNQRLARIERDRQNSLSYDTFLSFTRDNPVNNKKEWEPFRNALNKSERKDFDEMWDIARLYISACSNSVQLVPLQPIVISILFHHYRELLGCIREIEHMQSKASMNKQGFGEEMKKEKEEDSPPLPRPPPQQ